MAANPYSAAKGWLGEARIQSNLVRQQTLKYCCRDLRRFQAPAQTDTPLRQVHQAVPVLADLGAIGNYGRCPQLAGRPIFNPQ
jgi:hypothetical protein